MNRLHLISSEVNGVPTYYTADSSGAIMSIGTTLDYTKGFGDDILALISNSVYASLTNGKIWTDDTDVSVAVTIDTNGAGYVVTQKETAINTKGYSGIISITPNVSGNVLFAISFSGNEYFMTRGQGYVTSNTKLLPSDSTARAAIANIDASYNNLFDGSNTTVWNSTIPNSIIPILFTSARKLRKFSGRVGKDSHLPLSITLQVYDDSTSSFIDAATINVAAADVDFSQSFNNAITHTQYRFKVDYTDDGSGKVAQLEELNVYEETAGITWVGCSKEDIPTKGMTAATLAALNVSDYAPIFSNYQLDYAAYIPSGASFSSLVTVMPPNAAPNVSDFTASPATVHADNVTIGFKVTDLEGQSNKYKVEVGKTEIVPYTDTPAGGLVAGIQIPNSLLTVGANIITITAIDELGADQAYNFNITKVDKLPTYVGSLLNNEYTFTLNDADGDKVKYKTEFNGILIEPETDLSAVPVTHTTVIDKKSINIGKDNTLKITITDDVGGVTVITEKFIGDYFGLMFSDSLDSYFSDDLGQLIKKLSFGVVVSGRDSLPVEIKVSNKTNAIIKAVTVVAPGTIADGVAIKGCLNDQFVAEDTHSTLSIGDMLPNQKTSFFVKVISSAVVAAQDFDFVITGSGIKI